MQRNFQRWTWNDGEGRQWRCSECGAKAHQAIHVDAEGTERPSPYNRAQQTCSPACALARKTSRQRQRREEKRAQKETTAAKPTRKRAKKTAAKLTTQKRAANLRRSK